MQLGSIVGTIGTTQRELHLEKTLLTVFVCTIKHAGIIAFQTISLYIIECLYSSIQIFCFLNSLLRSHRKISIA